VAGTSRSSGQNDVDLARGFGEGLVVARAEALVSWEIRKHGDNKIITTKLTTMTRRINIVATGEIMQVIIRSIGNSRGVVLSKPLLAQVGLSEDDVAELTVEDGAIVLRKAARPLRADWAEAARALAAKGGDELVMGEFGNEADAELAW
jgi:antitoxin MazE